MTEIALKLEHNIKYMQYKVEIVERKMFIPGKELLDEYNRAELMKASLCVFFWVYKKGLDYERMLEGGF